MTKIGEFYRKFHGRFISRPTNFSWVIPGNLAGSGLPSSYDHLLWLIKNNIKTIITVREIPLPEAWIKKINSLDLTLDCFFLKTDDYNAPTVRELYDVVNYIDDQIINIIEDRKSTRLNSSHTEIYTLSLHDALPIYFRLLFLKNRRLQRSNR